MKELTEKEKAQRYDEAVSKLRHFMAIGVDPLITRADVQDFFPELKESEDEKMRAMAIKAVYAPDAQSCIKSWGINPDDVIAWLEKQGETSPILSNSSNTGKVEQKPDEDRYMEGYLNGINDASKTLKSDVWSEEDDINLEKAIWYVENPAPMAVKDSMLVGWLESFKYRVQPQPKQGWSDEDDRRINHIITFMSDEERIKDTERLFPIEEDTRWLKSLKSRVQPRSQWKPSDEQMYNLSEAAHYNCAFFDMEVLKGLYDDLKKLKEE